jgi:DTW domain-containing protein YfiP
MHQKEFRKTKNGTGHFTNLSLNNCELFVGIDFSKHAKVNEIINDKQNSCYVLFPSNNSINLNNEKLVNNDKNNVIFIIDSTWACAKSLLYDSPNINNLPKISFSHSKISNFRIKAQPKDYCLSTIESTLCVLELLNKNNNETIQYLDKFLLPFNKMVEYQIACANDTYKSELRYKKPLSK